VRMPADKDIGATLTPARQDMLQKVVNCCVAIGIYISRYNGFKDNAQKVFDIYKENSYDDDNDNKNKLNLAID